MSSNPADAWFKPRAQDYVCNNHPKPAARELSHLLAEHIGMSERNTRHLLDRLRHLSTCCREPEMITLLRLLPGSRQVRQPTELESEAMANGKPPPC